MGENDEIKPGINITPTPPPIESGKKAFVGKNGDIEAAMKSGVVTVKEIADDGLATNDPNITKIGGLKKKD